MKIIDKYIFNGVEITLYEDGNLYTLSPYHDEEVVYENLEKRWSKNNKMILQVETGRKYDSAVDVIPCRYTYEETDEKDEDIEPADIIYQSRKDNVRGDGLK